MIKVKYKNTCKGMKYNFRTKINYQLRIKKQKTTLPNFMICRL